MADSSIYVNGSASLVLELKEKTSQTEYFILEVKRCMERTTMFGRMDYSD